MLGALYGLCRTAVRYPINLVSNMIHPPVIVLLYHRVDNVDKDIQLLSVTPENFREHIKYLKDNFPVLRFEDDFNGVTGPSVVITFDDGYADNFQNALPILEEYNVPATFFVSTDLIGTDRLFWWDELVKLVLCETDSDNVFRLNIDGTVVNKWSTKTNSEKEVMFKEINPYVRYAEPVLRENILEQVREWAHSRPTSGDSHRIMNVDELKELSRSTVVTLGSHGVSHSPLSSLSSEEQKNEIFKSKRKLEDWTDKDISVFSYPFGGNNDYNDDSIKFCKDAGFLKVASNIPNQVRSGANMFEVPRFLVRNWSLEEFKSNIRKFWCI